MEPIQAHPRGAKESKESKKQLSSTQEETNSELKGTPQQKGKPQCNESEKNTPIVESLMFYNLLCDIEENLVIVFNKLNNIEYTSGVVNLSSYSLTNTETSQLDFCPTPGAPDIGNLIQDLDEFKRKTRLHIFFSGNNQNPREDSNQSDAPFEHTSFKNKSTFNPIGPFQLESVFYSIEQDLHRQNYTQPRHRNLSIEEYKAIKSLKTKSRHCN